MVEEYLKSFQNKMKQGYTLAVHVTSLPSGLRKYKLGIKNTKKNKLAAELVFSIQGHDMNINNGETFVYKNVNLHSYRGQGFGTFLRALATKAGSIAGTRKGRHMGVYVYDGVTNTRSMNMGVPASTRILPPGWKPVTILSSGMWSEYNYSKANIRNVNAVLNRIVSGWKS